MGSRNRCRDGMGEQGGRVRKHSADAFNVLITTMII
jgi:hypothetical protein